MDRPGLPELRILLEQRRETVEMKVRERPGGGIERERILGNAFAAEKRNEEGCRQGNGSTRSEQNRITLLYLG